LKILKDPEHSLILRPFGAAGRQFLAVTVLALFALDAPGMPLGEAELWDKIPGQLPDGVPLDSGMAKARGEFLLAGRAWTPRGALRQAQRVSVRVGGLVKHLEVFGDRWWDGGTITDPAPFASMPLDWARAFGGEGDPRNPAGRGLHPVPGPDGRPRLPLPNLELPDRLVGSPADRPEPAGFGPRELTHPGRQRRAGSWDERWRRERWPGFPDDLDYGLFNVAPEDQWLEGFIPAGAPVELRNLHPDHPELAFAVPGYPFRAFVTRRPDPLDRREEALRFEEVTLRTDTLWLFPGILRGVVVQRGVCEILDDEAEDVDRVLVVTEDPAAPRSLEAWLEIQRQRLAAPAVLPPEHAERIERALAGARERAAALPRALDDLRRQAFEPVPVVPRGPAELGEAAAADVAAARANLDRIEAAMRPLAAGASHLVEVDLDGFQAARASLDEAAEGFKATAAAGQAVVARAEATKARARQGLERIMAGPAGPEVRRQGINLDPFAERPDAEPWRTRGFAFAVAARKALERSPELQGRLRELGLTAATCRRAWIGWNARECAWPRADWGLGPDPAGEPLRAPAGLVLPRFEGKGLVRLLILQAGDWADLARWEPLLLEGSAAEPLFLPAPFPEGPMPVVCVGSEPEALLLDQLVSDRGSVAVRAAPDQALAGPAEAAVRAAPRVLAILPAGATAAEQEAWRAGGALAMPLPRGRDLFEARRLKVDLLAWVQPALPRTGPEAQAGAGDPEAAGLALPLPDFDRLGRIMDQVLAEAAAAREAAVERCEARMAELLETARETARECGLPDLDPGPFEPIPMEAMPAQLAEGFAQARAVPGADAAEVKARLDQAEAELGGITDRCMQLHATGEARLAETRAEGAALEARLARGGLPPGLEASFREAGLEPGLLEPLTREEVLARQARGGHLREANLEGLDLSEVDLAGMDCTGARCAGACFRAAGLEGARFADAICSGTDFSGARARGACFAGAVLDRARFPGADLEAADFSQCILKGADLTGVRAAGARFERSILAQVRLDRARLDGAGFNGTALDGCGLEEARLDRASFERCILTGCRLARADFSGAALHDTLLDGCTGAGTRFAGADLDRLRSGEGTALPGADFAGASLNGACLRLSAFPGASLRGCRMDDAVVEACDLRGADLRGVRARRARLRRSDLEGARLRGLDLLHGSLRKARLVRTGLEDANLHGVDFYKAVVGETRLVGANLERTLLQDRRELLP